MMREGWREGGNGKAGGEDENDEGRMEGRGKR
jgi:hypothetical protein